jgi:heptosyltransferase I
LTSLLNRTAVWNAIERLANESVKHPIERLLVVRLSAMGDVIHTLPAVQALREAFPRAHIGWLVEERWSELLCAGGFPRRGPRSVQRPLADEIHTVDLKGWRKSLLSVPTLQRMATVWNDVRDAKYEVAVDLQGAIRSAVLSRFSGAPTIYGAAEPRESPASLWYTRKIVVRGKHVIEQNLSIAQAVIKNQLGARTVLAHPNECTSLPRDPASDAEIERRLSDLGVQDFALLNPGAGWGAKRWPAGRYGEVARVLSQFGLHSILNFGPGEKELARSAEAASGGSARAMSCSVSELIALTRRARLFIGGDTGPLHLAAALGIPVVAIYGPTDPARNGPYGTRSIVLRNAESITSHARLAATDDGLLEISSDSVIAAAEKLLTGGTL